MDKKPDYNIMLFYSNINQISLKTKIMISEFINTRNYPVKIKIQEVNYDQDKKLSQQYGIMGTPAIIFFKNGGFYKKHFGEVTLDEFKIIVDNMLIE
jgi:thioredoxin-like negative regulator of GroEL